LAEGRVSGGSPEPLGVTPDPQGVNVAVASSTASAIDVCLFDEAGRERRIRLPGRTGEVFHGHVEGVSLGARYGLRAHGPFDPARGLRFDPGKLLIDPYATALDAPAGLHPSLFALPSEGLDSAPHVPKGVVCEPCPAAAAPNAAPWGRTVIYEAHVRGLTRLHPDVPPEIRGTFAALAHPAIVEHLRALGVTTLELLPVAAWIDERHLQPLGLTNYWGYNPIAFCAPDPRLAPGGWPEIRAATAALGEAGVEVILDVVFNHTGEGDTLGPTLSLRGLDNPAYYWLDPADPARYLDHAGTGHALRCDHPQTVRLAMDALRTWARRGGVAGFRFDLATVLGRTPKGFDPAAPLLTAILQDPELRRLKLIAEPWDLGPQGRQVGAFPAAFAEWNDSYRDGVRRFWGRHGATRGELATRLAGSADLFGAKRRPSRSVNFVVAHDGFTLADLVTYAAKRNRANGEDNRDGTDANWSWTCGTDGPTDDPGVLARRRADQRALLATLLLSRGVPMIAMGSELGHSQGGNNNAYAQDNATSWIDWTSASPDLAAFVGRLGRLRAEHPALRLDAFLTGQATEGPEPDVRWLDADGAELSASEWDDPQGPVLQMVLTAASDRGGPDRVVVILNRGDAPVEVSLPDPDGGAAWALEIDSGDPDHSGALKEDRLTLAARSVALAASRPSRRAPRTASDELVRKVAGAAGIAPDWWSIDGERRLVRTDTQRALLEAMGFPAGSADEARESLWRLGAAARAPLDPVRVAPAGAEVRLNLRADDRWLRVVSETGEAQWIQALEGQAALPALAAGRYELQLGEASAVLIAAPAAAFEPEGLARGQRLFGLSAQLYALRRDADQGVGDFSTLGTLAEAARDADAGFVAINPLHALFPHDRGRASPYHPSDRRFLDPLYLDLDQIAPGQGDLPGAGAELIDYPEVWRRKSQLLEAALGAGNPDDPEFEAFRRMGGAALHRFALHQAITEAHPGVAWPHWPSGLEDPDSAAAQAFAASRADRIRFHQRLQFLADRQLAEAAGKAPGLGLCRDLAVGAAADGSEVWSAQHLWARSASIGAPPDAFAARGQVWALPPPIPQAWTRAAYQPFAELLRSNMRHAGALRIDHAMGLQRLFWVPDGAEGADGAYVDYPFQDLLGVLALESVTAGCMVIGEDLGTVPERFRETLSTARVYGYSVLPFERDGDGFRPPGAYRRRALACATTHDLPPLEGWWTADDLHERAGLGLLAAGELQAALAERELDQRELLKALQACGLAADIRPDDGFSDALAAAIYAYVAASESQLVAVQAEDLAGETVSQNVPGTDRERPNWRRRLAPPVERLTIPPRAAAILDAVRAARLSVRLTVPFS
jgi:glycogen operon protein